MTNRHERRRHAKLVVQKTVTPEMARKLASLGSQCAWDGCEASTPTADLPEGWVWLLAFWSRRPIQHILDIAPGHLMRDCALCPEHALALDGLLKDLGRDLAAIAPAGEA